MAESRSDTLGEVLIRHGWSGGSFADSKKGVDVSGLARDLKHVISLEGNVNSGFREGCPPLILHMDEDESGCIPRNTPLIGVEAKYLQNTLSSTVALSVEEV